MNNCKHIIGIINDYEGTELVTFDELKKHIKETTDYINWLKKQTATEREPYTLNDYCDKRKATDLTRFEYCPVCGKKIDWNEMKRSE